MAYCFAWDQNNRGVWGCKATTMECDGRNEGCPFFKTNEQHKADRQAAGETTRWARYRMGVRA